MQDGSLLGNAINAYILFVFAYTIFNFPFQCSAAKAPFLAQFLSGKMWNS